jgi:hypothetical protein
MGTPNLVSLLRTFSKEEFKEFGKFVRSPYFNTHRDLMDYYSFLKLNYPDFSQPSFSKEVIFRKIYPGRKFSNPEMLKLNSRMNQLGNEYLKSKAERFTDDFKLLGEYLKRNLGKQFITLYKNLSSFIDNQSEIDNLIFVKKIYLESSFIRYNMNRDSQKQICSDIVKRGNYFAYQSLLWIMIQLRDMKANYNSFNYPFEESAAFHFIKSIDLEKLINGIKYEDNRLGRYLKYYISCILITLHPDNEKYFDEFRNSYRNIHDGISNMEKNNYLARLQTYIMKHIQAGNMKYLDILTEAYKYYFDNSDIFENNTIPVPPFRNAVLLSDFTGNDKFLDELTDVYSAKLNPELIEDSRKLCLAYRNFSGKDFSGCLNHLRKFSFRYLPHKTDVKHLLLKIFYEKKDMDSFFAHCDSFRHYLGKNKSLTTQSKSKYITLLNLSVKMYDISLSNGKNEAFIICSEVESDKYDLYYFDKRWVISKLKEIFVS